MRFDNEYRGINPTDVDAWERTVAIYRVARKAGARLRARDLITPDPEKWWREYAGPYLNRVARAMHSLLEERIAKREIALGLVTPDEDETVDLICEHPGYNGTANLGNEKDEATAGERSQMN